MQAKSLASKGNRSIAFKSPSCKRIQDRRVRRSKSHQILVGSTNILSQWCLHSPAKCWLVVSKQLRSLLLPLLERRLPITSGRVVQLRNTMLGNQVFCMRSTLEKRLPQWAPTVSLPLSLKNWHSLTGSINTQTALSTSTPRSKWFLKRKVTTETQDREKRTCWRMTKRYRNQLKSLPASVLLGKRRVTRNS